eukprot:575171-Pyramimonas_sp.AAC.1
MAPHVCKGPAWPFAQQPATHSPGVMGVSSDCPALRYTSRWTEGSSGGDVAVGLDTGIWRT